MPVCFTVDQEARLTPRTAIWIRLSAQSRHLDQLIFLRFGLEIFESLGSYMAQEYAYKCPYLHYLLDCENRYLIPHWSNYCRK